MLIFLIFCVINGDTHKALLLHIDVQVLSQKSICAIVWAVSWASGFFPVTLFLLERTTDRQTMIIQSWEFSGHFLKINKVNLSLQRKQLTIFIDNNKNLSFQVKTQILENLYLPLWISQLLNVYKHFSGEVGSDINKCEKCFGCYVKKWQHLEDMYSSGSQYFPNDQCIMLTKSRMGKRSTQSAG